MPDKCPACGVVITQDTKICFECGANIEVLKLRVQNTILNSAVEGWRSAYEKLHFEYDNMEQELAKHKAFGITDNVKAHCKLQYGKLNDAVLDLCGVLAECSRWFTSFIVPLSLPCNSPEVKSLVEHCLNQRSYITSVLEAVDELLAEQEGIQ